MKGFYTGVSITISGGTGISTGGTYPNFTITNTAPDQTVTLSGGTKVSISGTYPNFNISTTGITDTYVSGGTYSNGTITFRDTSGNTFNVNGLTTPFTGGTIGGGLTATTISATTYQGLPATPYLPLSGGTVSGNTIFNNGITANTISGLTFYGNGSGLTLTQSQITSALTYTPYNSTNPNGYITGYTDTYVTGLTYSSNTLTLSQNNGKQNISVGINNFTGLTVNGTLSATTISGGTFYGNGSGLTLTQIQIISGLTYTPYNGNLNPNGYINSGSLSNYLPLSGGTLTGNLSGTSISAVTFYGDGSHLTGINNGAGQYLPLSGGTMSGGIVANSGLTANTISQTQYIDFTTGSTNPSAVGGRIFFDNYSKALSYYDIQGNNLPIAMGQQLYIRVHNSTGVQIDKGKVIAVTGTTNELPSIILATNNHGITSARPIGLAAENIPSNGDGLVITNGILSGITLNTFNNGDTLYLSPTIPGGYESTTSTFPYTARTNEIGYVIETGTTTGKIYVTINNEDSNLTLTDIERNILEGNVMSTGTYEYTGMTQGTGQTINISPLKGWVVKNTYSYAVQPDVAHILYSGGTNIPLTYLSTAPATYILINSGSTVTQQITFPTPQQRRENIFIGKIAHPNNTTITSLNQTVDFDVSPMSTLRDLWTPLKLINQGVVVSPHSTTLEIETSAGTLWGNGIGWTTNQLNPDSVYITGQSPVTFQYRTQTGGTFSNVTTLDCTHYDDGGVVTVIPGNNGSQLSRATNQRVYLFPTGLVRIQYGQQWYESLTLAIAGIQNEIFYEYINNRDNGILIGIITVARSTTNLSDSTQAYFSLVSKFGELFGGTAGISTTTLQQAYDNSTSPEIVINSTLDGVTIKNGTGGADNITHLIEGQNSSGVVTSYITADGGFSGSSISATTYYGLPLDIKVTGGTYSNGTATFTNNTGGTFNVSGFTTPFTGGIVTGLTATTISGGTISANAFSATTSITSVNVRVTGSMALGANGTIGNGIDIEDSISGKDNYKVRLRNNDSTSDCRFQVVNDSGGHCNLLKMGSTATSQYTYFTTHDAGLYNSSTAGNIVLYNSFTSGKVNVIAVSAGVQLPSNGTSWNTLSDERDKINLSPITDALDKVNTLRTVTGRYKEDIEGTSRAFLIAQDVEKVLPEAVWKDDDEKETLRLSYTEVIPLLIASIKELTEKNNNLETRLKSLENKTP